MSEPKLEHKVQSKMILLGKGVPFDLPFNDYRKKTTSCFRTKVLVDVR